MMSRTTRNYLIRRYLLGPLTAVATWIMALAGRIFPALPRAPERPIFIVGCSRSGTTLFAEIFGAHSDLCHVMDASQVWDLRYYDPEADDFRDESHATDWEIARVRSSFALRMLMSGKPRLANKNNQNSVRLRYLKKIFPDAYVIHVVRDARPVVLSNLSRLIKDSYRQNFPFGRFPKPVSWRDYMDKPVIEQFAHQWQDITGYVRAQGTELFGPQRYAEVRFEDFCADPSTVLNRLDRFCSLPPHSRSPDVMDMIGNGESDAWTRRIVPDDLEKIVAITGPQLERFGYATESLQ